MWEEVFNLALSNGIWAVLFCFLLIYELKDSRKREQKYQQTIESLHSSLTTVNIIKEGVEEIRTAVSKTHPIREAEKAARKKAV